MSNRIPAGGKISVKVNGATVESHEPKTEDLGERPSGNVGDKVANPSQLSKATITLRSGAQRFSDGSSDLMHNSSSTSSNVDINGTTPQLKHVIRVETSSGENMEKNNNVASAANKAKIRITTDSSVAYVDQSKDYGKDKISVVVGSPGNDIIKKAEDERSSSGASSAPGSDFERSDSDREADDGTDSGFSPSTRHCARISVNVKNAGNHPSTISSSTSESCKSGKTKTSVNIVSANNRPSSANSVTSESCKDSKIKTSVNVSTSNNRLSSANFSTSESCKAGKMKNSIVCHDKDNNVRLRISSYESRKCPENIPDNRNGSNDEQWSLPFHMHELENVEFDKNRDYLETRNRVIANAWHSDQNGQNGQLVLENKVVTSIASLLQEASKRHYDEEEKGRIIFYTTTLGVVRQTFDRCAKVRKILETLMVKFEERDLFMNRALQHELKERLGLSRVVLPQVFVEGRHLGGAELVHQLNETGYLRELLRPYKRNSVGGVCPMCGGFKYFLCHVCGGSKKSLVHRHNFVPDLVALRCVLCDESGLVRCPQCRNGEF